MIRLVPDAARVLRRGAACAALVAFAAVPSAARAADVTIGLPPAPPSADSLVTLSFTGTAAGAPEDSAYVYAKVRQATGAPCGPTYASDPGESLFSSHSATGPYLRTETFTPPVA